MKDLLTDGQFQFETRWSIPPERSETNILQGFSVRRAEKSSKMWSESTIVLNYGPIPSRIPGMDKNFAIIRNEKIKTTGSVLAVLKEMLPDEKEPRTSPRAIADKSSLNTNSGTASASYQAFQGLLPKKRRSNAVVALMQVVTTSREFKNKTAEKNYYADARKFIEQNMGKIVGWSIHRDETSTHMQVVTIPLVDGKLNARKLIGGKKTRMNEIQDDFYEQVGKKYDLDRGVKGSKAVHKTVEEFHKDTKKSLDRIEDALQTREDALHEQILALDDKIHDTNDTIQYVNTVADQRDRENKLASYNWAQVVQKENLSATTPQAKLLAILKDAFGYISRMNAILKTPLDRLEEQINTARKFGCKDLHEFLVQPDRPKLRFKKIKRDVPGQDREI